MRFSLRVGFEPYSKSNNLISTAVNCFSVCIISPTFTIMSITWSDALRADSSGVTHVYYTRYTPITGLSAAPFSNEPGENGSVHTLIW
jgi:hypothetical protein